MWSFKHQKQTVVRPIDPEVDKALQRTHAVADQATQNAERLNEVFRQNGITLNILRAAGSKK